MAAEPILLVQAIIYAVGIGVMSRRRLPQGAARRQAPAPPWPRGRDLRVLVAPLALRLPRLTRRLSATHTSLLLWTGGRLASRWFGAAVLVLETVGRRTGKPRAAPIVYLPDGENLVVVPANGGAHRPPAWWLNLQAAGGGVAVLGRERRPIRPFEAAGAERERLWRRFAAISPVDHYQRRTHRRIPVVVLAPAADRPSSPPPPIHDPLTGAVSGVVDAAGSGGGGHADVGGDDPDLAPDWHRLPRRRRRGQRSRSTSLPLCSSMP